MGKVYQISITSADDSSAVAEAYGTLDVIQYVARKAKETMAEGPADTEYVVRVSEVNAIGQPDTVATLVNVTGDAEVAGYVLSKKLRTAAKAENVQEEDTAEDATPSRRRAAKAEPAAE